MCEIFFYYGDKLAYNVVQRKFHLIIVGYMFE